VEKFDQRTENFAAEQGNFEGTAGNFVGSKKTVESFVAEQERMFAAAEAKTAESFVVAVH